jgi:Phosphotransferase enzyme family
VTRWTEPSWIEAAHGWIRAELARSGIDVVGPIEQPHVRPWATAMRVPTTAGVVWFKASTQAFRHEAAVVQVLSRVRPDCVPELLGVDVDSGWMLLADGGTRFRELNDAAPDFDRWEEMLVRYAELQIDLMGARNELLERGAPDRGLAAFPALYEGLLADSELLRVGEPGGLTGDEVERLRALAPELRSACERLAAVGIPETIQHDDLHDGNVFVQDGRYLFFDWGDSCVGHPFFTLAVSLDGVLAYDLAEAGAPNGIDHYRDLYLEPFTRFASRRELIEVSTLARRLGWIGRALVWQASLPDFDDAARVEWQDAVPTRMRLFLGDAA